MFSPNAERFAASFTFASSIIALARPSALIAVSHSFENASDGTGSIKSSSSSAVASLKNVALFNGVPSSVGSSALVTFA